MTTYVLGTFRVWVAPAYAAGSAYHYPWSLGAFVHESRMIPERVSKRTGGMGSASFRYLRAWREEGNGPFYDAGFANVGCYVAVTAGVTAFTHSAVIFWGFISQRSITEVAYGTDKAGSLTALGLGYLLDGTQLSGFRQGAASASSVPVLSTPTFNLQGDGGVVIGNRLTDSDGIPVFASLPSACSPSALFSRLNVLQHVLKYCKPSGMPLLGATGSSAISTYLNDTTSKEIFDLSNVTLKGAIDLLISRAHGFGYDVVPNVGGGWDIQTYPLIDSDSSAYDPGYPTATPVDVIISSAAAESVAYVEDASDLWDAVTVEGDNILIGVTASFADSNLAKGWTASQETAYRAGATADAGYLALTPEQKVARNEQLRNASGIADVFQLYTLALTSTAITRSTAPGTGGTSVPLVPEISWTGSAASVNDSVYRTPYLPGARLSRSVPWLAGVAGSGADGRDAAAIARPAYLDPRVFNYNTSPGAGESVCQDLMVPWLKRASPTVTPDDRTPGLRVVFNPPETMAKGSWTDGTDGIGRIDNIAADPFGRPFDYTKLAVTVGVPSDQRVSVTKRRYGVPAGSERRVLVVTDATLQCWVTLAGTIVGSKADGSADRVATHTFIRNDFATAERLAAMYAAFAFRRRTSLSITLAQPDVLPAWASIGTMIGRLTELAASGAYPAAIADAYTVVESIDYNLTAESPRVTIGTTLPSAPALNGGGGASPSSGGFVSQTLGGTVAQAVNVVQGRAEEIAQRTARVPTSIGRDAGSAATSDGASIRATIAVANTFAAGDVVYNNAGAWAKALANNAAGTAKYSGVVESATGTDFVIVYAGEITHALTAGTTYYLSDVTAGLLVLRASLTLYEPNVAVLRCISATKCIVMPGRDTGSDLTTLSAGDVTNGGGELVVNMGASGMRVTADDTDGLVVRMSATNRVQVATNGTVTIDQPGMALSVAAGVVTITYSTNSVVIDPAHITGTSRAFRMREIDVCNSSGVAKKMQLLCTDLY